MQIFGIMVVKDEQDIIEHTLRAAETWADKVFVLDNGSTDGTWETVQSLANDTIVALKQDHRVFSNSLRREVFQEKRHLARNRDWWCYRLDADEFYVDDPRRFLARVPPWYQVVRKKSVDYMITTEDLEEYDFTGDFSVDQSRLRYVQPTAYTEPRFFRHRKTLDWPQDRKGPRHMGEEYPEPILVRHYQYRSPQQIARRLAVRQQSSIANADEKVFRHVTDKTWDDFVEPRDQKILDQGLETYHALPSPNLPKRRPIRVILRNVARILQILP